MSKKKVETKSIPSMLLYIEVHKQLLNLAAAIIKEKIEKDGTTTLLRVSTQMLNELPVASNPLLLWRLKILLSTAYLQGAFADQSFTMRRGVGFTQKG